MTKKKNFSKTVAAITAISLAAATPLSAFADVIEGGDGEGGTYIYTYDSEDIKDLVSNDESASGIILLLSRGYNRTSVRFSLCKLTYT